MIAINNGNKKSINGAASELKAAAWLMEQGYEVYRNVSQHGQNDLVVYDKETGEFKGYDVKTANFYIREDGSVAIHHAKNKTNTPYILVLPNDEIMVSDGTSIEGYTESDIVKPLKIAK
jgi:hypothetical protein